MLFFTSFLLFSKRVSLLPTFGRFDNPNCLTFPFSNPPLGGEAQVSLPTHVLILPFNSLPAHSRESQSDFTWQHRTGAPGLLQALSGSLVKQDRKPCGARLFRSQGAGNYASGSLVHGGIWNVRLSIWEPVRDCHQESAQRPLWHLY